MIPCKPCRVLDACHSGMCDTHKRARINYDTPPQQRAFIVNAALAFGYELKVEKRQEPELML